MPAHDDINTYVQLLFRLALAGHLTKVWCQDLWAAYRQFPVQRPNQAFALLLTPAGPTLWQHSVLPFGASSSVWFFNRCVDALAFLARSLLLILLIHYVDDIGCPDSATSAGSSFKFFAELCEILGMRLKPSKAQAPATRHKLLGVVLEVLTEGIRLSPAPERVQKVLAAIEEALLHDALEPAVAQRLTGKLGFLATTMFGQAAVAALHLLYSRAHDRNDQVHFALNGPLRCSLRSLKMLLTSIEPRWIPFQGQMTASATVYADAFFELGDKHYGLSDEPPEKWASGCCRRYTNGWGFVVRAAGRVRYAHGFVPADVLALFTSRRAFIYCLEIFGQILAAVTCHDILPTCWLGFCEDTAGKAALTRGYGRDEQINNLLACFWAVAQRLHWQPHFEWVPSDLNIEDPFSRGDCSIGVRHGWEALASSTEPLWPIFNRVAGDLDYALGGASFDISQLRWAFQSVGI